MGLLLNATGDLIDHGSASSLDGMSAFSAVFWVKLASIAATDNYIWSRLNDGASSRHWFGVPASGTELRFGVLQATTSSTYISSGASITTDVWYYLAFTYDNAASPKGRIYIGKLDTLAAEVSYGTQNNGSGAKQSDDAQNWIVGNRSGGGRNANGHYAFHAAWNRALSLDEIRQQQFAPHPTNGCVIFSHYGSGGANTAYDWSGAGNPGTCTGAGAGDSVPLGNWFGRSMRPYLSLPLAGASASVSAPPITAGGVGQIPAVTGGRNATVAGSLAVSTAQALAPAVSGIRNATIAAPIGGGLAQACAPAASGVRAASVTTPAGAAQGMAAGPDVSGSAVVGGLVGQARSQALGPAVSGAALAAAQTGAGRATGQTPAVSGAAAVNAPAGQASVSSPAAIVSGAARVSPPSGSATGQAGAPAVSAARNASVAAPASQALGLGQTPAVETGGFALVHAPTISAGAQGLPAGVSAVAHASVAASAGQGATQAMTPAVAAGGSVETQAPVGMAGGQAAGPSVTGARDVSVEVPAATGIVLTVLPGVSGETGQVDALVLAVMITAIAAVQIPRASGRGPASGEMVEFAGYVRRALRLEGRIAQAWKEEAAITQRIAIEVER